MKSSAPILAPRQLDRVRERLRAMNADGWLLYDFHDQNPLAHHVLGLRKTTRRAFAFLPTAGVPVVLHHPVDASAWAGWPWEVRQYSTWSELPSALENLLAGTAVVAMETSPGNAVPTVDRVPAGVVELIRTAGSRIVTSADLVTMCYALWSPDGLAKHRVAARTVRSIALEGLERASHCVGRDDAITDRSLMDWIVRRLREAGLTDQTGCIVAAGADAADPHYEPSRGGRPLRPDSLVLVDLWGRDPDGGIPADQTWMGFLGSEPPDRMVEVWTAVRDARDAALAFLDRRARDLAPVFGHEVDEVARAQLEGRGFGRYFVHRLGHSIDRELHGSGPNLDSLETRDERRLLPGVGFSVEPGVYIPGELGVRSEVNVHWGESGPEVTPVEIQRDLLCFPLQR